jgi:hypothetical protein
MVEGDPSGVTARPGHGSDSPESSEDHALDLVFEWGFLLWQHSNEANLFGLSWNGGGRRWRLAMVRWFGSSSASVSVVSGAPPAKIKAPQG